MRLPSLSLALGVVLALCTFTGRSSAQTPAPAPLDFSGLIFGNFQYRTDSAARAQAGGKHPNKFDVERVYLTFRMPAGDRASIRVTTDIFQNASNGYYGGWTVRLKYAYLQYAFTNALAGVKDLGVLGRIGVVHNVVIDQVELFWPRWFAQTAVERSGFFSSADVGAASLVTLPKRRGEIYATVTNGPGYAAAESDRFKDVGARLTLTPFTNDSGALRTFAIIPWLYRGATASAIPSTYTDGLARDRYGVVAGVRDRRLTAAAEWARRVEDVESFAPARAVSRRTGEVFSAFAIARPTEWFAAARSPLFVIARVDRFAPSVDADARNQFVLVGAGWDLNSRVSFALDYQAQTYADYATGAAPADQRVLYLHWQTTF